MASMDFLTRFLKFRYCAYLCLISSLNFEYRIKRVEEKEATELENQGKITDTFETKMYPWIGPVANLNDKTNIK